MPHLVKVRKGHNESDLVVVGIDIWEQEAGDERARIVRQYVKENNLNFTVVIGDDAMAEAYNVDGIPNAVLIDADGKKVFQNYFMDADFEQALKKALADLREKKMKDLREAVSKGDFEVSVVRGKGPYSTLWKKPQGFKIATISGNKVAFADGDRAKDFKIGADAVKLVRDNVESILSLQEKADVKPGDDSLHVVVRSKNGYYFIVGSAAKSAPRAVEQLAEWVDKQVQD